MFSSAVERALRTAIAAHEGQLRKGLEPVPYVTHSFHVALILARAGLDEVVIQAGLLHDVVEDCEGWTIARVEQEFGREVAHIVGELTENKTHTWQDRKQHQIDSVATLSAPALSIKAADKLHNLATLAADLRAAQDPGLVWQRFSGGRERTLEMSARLVAELEPRVQPELARALREVLRELQSLARG
ncbi:MAG: HD domain-containing protein [Planctomycetes bacterium]|nr:HD domain-containing protein [Planctomycetota bacterium]